MLITNAVTRKWTRDEYYQMAESGIFRPDERVELIEGEIIVMSPPGPQHSFSITKSNTQLAKAYGDTHDVSVQNPLDLGVLSQPQPDFALVPAGSVRVDAHPQGADLVIEVARSSLAFDRNEKAALYAKGGIPEYWIVDLVNRQIEVFRDPGPRPDLQGAFEYRHRQVFAPESSLQPLVVPGPPCRFSIFFD